MNRATVVDDEKPQEADESVRQNLTQLSHTERGAAGGTLGRPAATRRLHGAADGTVGRTTRAG